MAENLEMVALVAERLGDLCNEVVFLGGAVTELLVTDPAAPGVRPTKDVDVIVEIGSHAAYAEFSERLRKLGYQSLVLARARIC